MDWRYLFFDFNGRISRKPWWICGLILVGIALAFGAAAGATAVLTGAEALVGIAAIIFVLAIMYPSMALGAKRLHDRGKSAWWLILFYVLPNVLEGIGGYIGGEEGVLPLSVAAGALGIWGLVELGFLKGEQGPNAYGPDPLGGTQADASL